MTNLIEKLIAGSWNRLAAPSGPSSESGSQLDLGFQVIDGEVKRLRAFLPDTKRQEHAAILGKTGTGKSSLLRYCASQDIHRRCGFTFFDLHGDTMPYLLRVNRGGRGAAREPISVTGSSSSSPLISSTPSD